MKTLKLEPHLEVTEISKKLSSSQKSHHRCHWQILLSIAINPNKQAKEYAAFLGVSISKIYRVVQRYNTQGADAIESASWGGRRKGVELLTLEEEAVMMASIKTQALQGHVLTMHDIRNIVETRVNQTVSDDYLWDLFKRHNWKKKLPRPEHPKKNQQAQEEFKKNFPASWQPMLHQKIRGH